MSSTLEDFIMSALHKKVLMILEGLYTPPMNREFHELSSDSETPLSIFFSDDGDAHLIPTSKISPIPSFNTMKLVNQLTLMKHWFILYLINVTMHCFCWQKLFVWTMSIMVEFKT